MLSRVRMTFPEIRNCITAMEEGLLTEQMLKSFIELLPLPEEVIFSLNHSSSSSSSSSH